MDKPCPSRPGSLRLSLMRGTTVLARANEDVGCVYLYLETADARISHQIPLTGPEARRLAHQLEIAAEVADGSEAL